MDFKGNMFENEQTKDDILELVDRISNYDIFDFLAKISGLNLLPQNQNKSVLLDTLIQYVLAKEEINYKSTNKMSAGKFKSIINGLNSTDLSLSIDPCENIFIQNVMMGTNYRVFNGIDSTPAYNLQALIRVLFQYQNNFDEKYSKKVYRLFSLILGISEEIIKSLDFRLEDIKYDEQQKVILPSSDIVSKYAEKIVYPLDKVKGYIEKYFDIENIAIEFGKEEIGDIDNRPFYKKPFLVNARNNTIIILNIALLPSFAFYKAIEWADEYNLKKAVLNRYNDYLWLESIKTLDKLGHKKIDNKALGLECISLDYYKEMIATVYNNQLMLVFLMCDDGEQYPEKGLHIHYPDERHNDIYRKRIKYFDEKIKQIDIPKEEWCVLIINNGFGRSFRVGSNLMSFMFKPIQLNTFELHCIGIKERNITNFLPRYIRAKNQLNTMMSDVFSELNSVCIYTSNNYTFYMSDNISMDVQTIWGRKKAAKREESHKSSADEENVMDRNELVFLLSSDFMDDISKILEEARRNVETAVNLSMVYAYYEIGRKIIEEEQNGENRAAYGKQILKELSKYLTQKHGKGYSAENLKLMRRFYMVYSQDQIGETVLT